MELVTIYLVGYTCTKVSGLNLSVACSAIFDRALSFNVCHQIIYHILHITNYIFGNCADSFDTANLS